MMFKRVLLLAALVAVLLMTPVAAADIVVMDEEFTEFEFTGGTRGTSYSLASNGYSVGVDTIYFADITRHSDVAYVTLELKNQDKLGSIEEGRSERIYTIGNRQGTAYVYVQHARNLLGQVTSTTFDIFPQNWNIEGLSGEQSMTIYPSLAPQFYGAADDKHQRWNNDLAWPANSSMRSIQAARYAGFEGGYNIVVSSGLEWKNRLTVRSTDNDCSYQINLKREYGEKSYFSKIDLKRDDVTVLSDYAQTDFWYITLKSEIDTINITSSSTTYSRTLTSTVGQPCTIYVYDADTRLPLAGDWEYYIVVEGSDAVSGSASGASTEVNLPETSILQPHLLRVTKEGYEQTAPLAFDVPVGGREIKVYLSPLETTAPEGSSVVTFVVADIETGVPVGSCLVNVDGVGKYAGASGTAWFVLPENTTHQWVVTAEGYWPIGGNFTLGVDDLTIPVELTKKTSDLPRPPLPDLPNFPVIHPSLDPAGFRMHILSVPYLGDMAEPLLDTVDNLAAGVNDIVFAVLDVLTAPADSLVLAVKGISAQLVEVSEAYLSTGVFVLDSLGMLIAVIPTKVINLVTFGMILDIIILLLRGGL